MPSPLVHTTLGYVVYKIYEPQPNTPPARRIGPLPLLLLYTTAISMLPDLDSVLGILTGDFGRYHNNATHSLIVGLAIALVFGGVVALLGRSGFWKWFLITLLSYESHVLLDYFTVGRGVMALWPLSQSRFSSLFPLFYGFHWSQGILSLKHVWTFLTESATAAMIILIVHMALRRSRSRVSDMVVRDTGFTFRRRRSSHPQGCSEKSKPGDNN